MSDRASKALAEASLCSWKPCLRHHLSRGNGKRSKIVLQRALESRGGDKMAAPRLQVCRGFLGRRRSSSLVQAHNLQRMLNHNVPSKPLHRLRNQSSLRFLLRIHPLQRRLLASQPSPTDHRTPPQTCQNDIKTLNILRSSGTGPSSPPARRLQPWKDLGRQPLLSLRA